MTKILAALLAIALIPIIIALSNPPSRSGREQSYPPEQRIGDDHHHADKQAVAAMIGSSQTPSDPSKKQDRDYNAPPQKWWLKPDALTAWFTFGLILAGAGQMLLFLFQLRLIRRTLEPALRQADAIRLAERAYVKMSHNPPGVQFADSGSGVFWISLSVKNYGRTPARVLKSVICHATAPTDQPFPVPPDYGAPTARHAAMEAFLVANDFAGYPYEAEIPPHHFTKVKNGSYRFWVFGYVEYIDAFDRTHRAGYGRVYEPRLDEEWRYPKSTDDFKNRSNLVFITEPDYNYDRERGNDKAAT
jgi:hypothetical protein